MKEIWKDIKGYEGLYQVSNLGRVKSLERYKVNHNIKQLVEEKILKPSLGRYKKVCLCKNSKYQTLYIHRLVADAFIPNTNNDPCVNHIDGNKYNNVVNNLEFCTISQNTKHAYDLGLKKPNNRYTK